MAYDAQPMVFLMLCGFVFLGFMNGVGSLVVDHQISEYPTTEAEILGSTIQNRTSEGTTYHQIVLIIEYTVDNESYHNKRFITNGDGHSNYTFIRLVVDQDYPVGEIITISYYEEDPEVCFMPRDPPAITEDTVFFSVLFVLSFAGLMLYLLKEGWLTLIANTVRTFGRELYTDENYGRFNDFAQFGGMSQDITLNMLKANSDVSVLTSGRYYIRIAGSILFVPVFFLLNGFYALSSFEPSIQLRNYLVVLDFEVLYFTHKLLGSNLTAAVICFIALYLMIVSTIEEENFVTYALIFLIFAPVGIVISSMVSAFMIMALVSLFVIPITVPLTVIVVLLASIVGLNESYIDIFGIALMVTTILIIVVVARLHQIHHWVSLIRSNEESRTWIGEASPADELLSSGVSVIMRYANGRTYSLNTDGEEQNRLGTFTHIASDGSSVLCFKKQGIEIWENRDNNLVVTSEMTLPESFPGSTAKVHVSDYFLAAIGEGAIRLFHIDMERRIGDLFDTLNYDGTFVDMYISDKRMVVVSSSRIQVYSYTLDSITPTKTTDLQDQITSSSSLGDIIVIGMRSGQIKEIDLLSGTELDYPTNRIAITALHSTGDFVFAGMKDGSIQVFHKDDGKFQSQQLQNHSFAVTHITVTNGFLISAGYDGAVIQSRLEDHGISPRFTAGWRTAEEVSIDRYCYICKDSIGEDSETIECASCGVVLHEGEIRTWLTYGRSKNRCPLCRNNILT